MASILKHLRSSTADKRPTASGLADGQIAINTASGTPAMFFKDSAGNIVKVGPAHTGTTAPNASPAGSAGNSNGELWIDESLTTRGLKYYDGATFINLTPSGTTSTVGLVELATDAETQTGTDSVRAVTPSGLQSKVSDSTATTSSTTIASSTAVKSAFDLANAALPKAGGTLTGELLISPSGSLVFEGSSDDSFETTIAVTNPTADRTITFPNVTGNVVTTGDSGTITSTMIADGTIVDADINAAAAITHSKLANITAGSVLLGNASNVPTATALSGDVTINSSGVTAISAGVIVNADINASAAIVDTKLDTISTADKVSLSALNIDGATDIGGALENGDLFVVDDGAGGTNRKAQAFRMAQLTYSGVTGDITVASGGTAAISTGVIVNADVNASAAIAGTKISPDFGSQTITTTGVVSAALGAAATPSLTFTGDTNTGIYSPGADQVAISTGGSGRLFVDASGNVGVGASPTARLEVSRLGSTWSGSAPPAGTALFIHPGGGTASSPAHLALGAGNSAISSIYFGDTDSASRGVVQYTHSEDALQLFTAGSERLRITSTGALNFVGAGTAGVTQAVSFNGSAPVNSLVIDSSGRLGVGTSSPDVGLHYRGDTPKLRIESSNTLDTTAGTEEIGRLEWEGFRNTNFNAAASIRARQDGTWSTTTAWIAPSALEFYTQNNTGVEVTTPRMLIDSSGNVGIGTSAPQAELNVAKTGGASTVYIESDAGNNATTSILRFGGASGRSASIQGFRGASSNIQNLDFYTYNSGDAFGMRLTSTGLGIGTTSPQSVLHVAGTSPQLILDPGVGSSDPVFVNSYRTNSPLGFKAGDTERARIDSSGRLLVGTSTAPTVSDAQYGLLRTQGNTSSANGFGVFSIGRGQAPASITSGSEIGHIYFTANDGSAYSSISGYSDGTSGTNDYPGRLVFSTTADGASSPTERMRIRQDGSVCLVKGISLGDGNRDVQTSIYFGGSVIASGAGNSTLKYSTSSGLVTYDTSSRLVKDNIADCPYGLAEVLRLQPRKYFRTDDQRDEIGFIADELVGVLPEFVPIGPKSVITKNEDDTENIPLGVNYEKLTAVLTKALQEAIARIESLEAKVAALESA